MLYEESSVLPYANLELFSTAILEYPSEFFCWYIVVVELKVTETILSARMAHFKMLPYHHYIITALRHFTITPFNHVTTSAFHHFTILSTISSL